MGGNGVRTLSPFYFAAPFAPDVTRQFLLSSVCVQSPDLTALIRWSHHSVTFFTTVGLGELGHVRERTVHAELRQRMWISRIAQPRGFGPDVLRPDLGPAEKETLLGREAINIFWTRLAVKRFLISSISDRQAAEVGDRLSDYKLAFLM